MLDGGRAYTVKRALELLRRVEEHELYWFEEPLRARRPRRLPPPLRCRAGADRRGRGRLDPRVPSARWSSTATSTFCNPISRDAAASRSHGRSRCSSAWRPSRSCRTASRRVCSSRHRCTSWRRSTAPPGRSTPSPTRRSSTGSCASRSRFATAGCRCRPARASGSSSTRTPSTAPPRIDDRFQRSPSPGRELAALGARRARCRSTGGNGDGLAAPKRPTRLRSGCKPRRWRGARRARLRAARRDFGIYHLMAASLSAASRSSSATEPSPSTASVSTSTTASSWCCSGRRAVASPPRCAWSRASRTRRRARSCSTARWPTTWIPSSATSRWCSRTLGYIPI